MIEPNLGWIDIETRCSIDLRKSNVYRYTESPDFEILMAAWSRDGETVQVAVGREEIEAIPGLLDPDVTWIAHNAQFERICLSRFAGMPVGTYLDPRRFEDTQAIAAERGYPRKLKQLALALGAEEKDEAGTRLINTFSIPNKRMGRWYLPEEKPEEWAAFINYCRQDVATLIDIYRRLQAKGGWPTKVERSVYIADQLINDRGMAADIPMAQRAVAAAEDNRMLQELEIMSITGISNPGSQPQLLGWLQASGLPIRDLTSATVSQALDGPLTDAQRRVLELRQELALVAAKKFTAALSSVCTDGRLRGGFRFFGAHTGRWAGSGVQPHNLPRAQLEGDPAVLTTRLAGVTDKAERERIEAEEGEKATAAAVLDLQFGEGADAHTLKALVRAMFTGPLTVVDYAAIEARVISWLAGEEWALDAFRAGRDIYVETAERMSTPGNQLTRSDGKVAVLALGFQGGVGSLRVMGAEGTDEHLQTLVMQWRRANRKICRLWQNMDEAFRIGGRVGEHLRIERDGSSRHLVLPSGRAISYHEVRYDHQRASFRHTTNPQWRQDTYGGRLSENATQAIARDLLARGLVRLEKEGHRTVGHVHDEFLVEGEEIDEVVRLVCQTPKWATGLPVNAEGAVVQRYRKS